MRYKVFTSASPLSDLNFDVAAGKKVRMVLVFVGEISGEININCTLAERTMVEFYVATVLRGRSDFRLNYLAEHVGAESESKFVLRGNLDDEARKKSTLGIHFAKGAVGAIGSEDEKVFLLSEDARNISIPRIDCDEDDVAGKHSASTGSIDADALKFLMSRGLTERAARKRLEFANVASIINMIDDEKVLKCIYEELDYEA